MKKLFLALLSVALLATSCEKQTTIDPLADGQEIDVTVNLSTEAATRGTNPDGLVYYLESYFDGEFFKSYGSNEDGVFDVRLVTGLEFTFVAWADYDQGCYTIGETLEDITVNYENFSLNDELRDAFFGAEPATFTASNSVVNMELGRPFARINVYTLDFDQVVDTQVEPLEVNLTYGAGQFATTFDAFTGLAGSADNLEFTTTVAVDKANYNEEDGTLLLSYDYLLTPVSPERGVVNFDVTFNTASLSNIAEYPLANIPFERNYQTNVYGSLITKQGEIYITVNEEWETPDIITYVDEEGFQTAIGQILPGTDTYLTLAQDITGDVSIVFPSNQNYTEANVYIELTGKIYEDATLTFTRVSGSSTAATFHGNLYITVLQDNPGNLSVNMVNATATLYGPGSINKLNTYLTNGGTIAKGFTLTTSSISGPLYVYGTQIDMPSTSKKYYIAIGADSDRPDMTQEEAVSTYITNTADKSYAYSGIILEDGTIYTVE